MMAEYRNTLLVYLDILGFQDLIHSTAVNRQQIDVIIRALQHMKRQSAISFEARPTKAHNFSDLIVRATQLRPDIPPNVQINEECWLLAAIQCDLVLHYSILLRGGMCMSELYIDDNLVFGPALIRAYQLGEKLAVFPRILVDPAIIDLEETDRSMPIFNVFIRRGEDGSYFIDYLYACYVNPNILLEFAKPEDLLKAHKEVVHQKLIELSAKGGRTKQKAIWLALYHNSVLNRLIRKLPDKEEELTSLMIIEDELRR